MTTKADFSTEEWDLIMKAPAMAALAVIAASPSGPFGIVKEMVAVARVFSEASTQGTGNSLIQGVVSEIKEQEGRPEQPALERALDAAGAKSAALEHCRKVADLLNSKAQPEEAEEFKRWLVTCAQRAAEASKEGGFLGIGGTRVSDEEKVAIGQVAGALGVTV